MSVFTTLPSTSLTLSARFAVLEVYATYVKLSTDAIFAITKTTRNTHASVIVDTTTSAFFAARDEHNWRHVNVEFVLPVWHHLISSVPPTFVLSVKWILVPSLLA